MFVMFHAGTDVNRGFEASYSVASTQTTPGPTPGSTPGSTPKLTPGPIPPVGGLSPGAIVGISVAVPVLITMVIAAFKYYRKWKKQKNEDVPQPEMESLKPKSDN